MRELEARLARRELLQLCGYAGLLGSGLVPRLAHAAARDKAFMPQLTGVIERWVGPGKFPGMIAAVGFRDREPQYVARGSEGFTDADAMTPDSLFRIYSMTKPITGMAAMLLIGEGRMGLDQPVGDVLPKFARMQVQVTPDGSLTDVRPATTPMTMRHLMTHTAGLGYTIIQQGPLKQALIDKGLSAGQVSRLPLPGFGNAPMAPSLEVFAERLSELPLVYDPGTKWSYSIGLDLMGRVIEVVSGMPFERFLAERIFGPCGMGSTWFQVPANASRRLTTNYGATNNTLVPIDKGEESIYLTKPPYPFGGSGLVSSPRDYDRFLRMLAQGGRIRGRRVIPEAAVRIGTSDLLPAGVAGPTMMAPKSGFGAGGRVGMGDEAGIFGWAGAAGTVGTVDMRRGTRTGIYVQFMPPNANSLLSEYQQALRADLTALAGKAK